MRSRFSSDSAWLSPVIFVKVRRQLPRIGLIILLGVLCNASWVTAVAAARH